MKLITKFEDEDFRLNETANVDIATMPDGRIKAQAVAQSGGLHTFFYNDLKTFANDWEDIPEEPKIFYYINGNGYVLKDNDTITQDYADRLQEIGNYFETETEAEIVVEKLKAWKWLKDNGVSLKYDKDKFILHIVVSGKISPDQWQRCGYMQKIDLLFGGEE